MVSVTATAGTYILDAEVAITVTFDEPVLVNGTPELMVNTGGTALYDSGSTTAALRFLYTVTSSDTTSTFYYSSTSALANSVGGSTRNAGNTADANLALSEPATDSFADITLDGAAPTAMTTITVAKTDGTSLTTGDTTTARSLVLSGTVSGTLDASDRVNIYDGGTLLTQVVVIGTTWNYTDNSLVFTDSPMYSARVADAAGNLGAESTSFNLFIRAVSATFTITDLVSMEVEENDVYTSVTPVVVSGESYWGVGHLEFEES